RSDSRIAPVEIRLGGEKGMIVILSGCAVIFPVNVGIVRDVITEVCHWGRENRRQPNRIDAELDQIRQTLRDSSQVTNAVAVGVLKRPRIDLIDDAGLPPKCALHGAPQVGSAMMMV